MLAANHWSNFDPVAARAAALPAPLPALHGEVGALLVPARLRSSRARRRLPGAARASGDEEAVATAVELCREGHVVVMFPEGTRREKGLRKKHEARWHTGAARIALEAGVPLVPAGDRRHRPACAPRAAARRIRAPIELDDLAGAAAADGATDRDRAAARRRSSSWRSRSRERPLLVVDGDSFAHRAYHALPEVDPARKTAAREHARRLLEHAPPALAGRAAAGVLVGLGHARRSRPTGTRRSTAYQAGREFDDELLEQLDLLPELVASSGVAYAKAPGYEADDFLAAAVAAEEAAGGTALVATSDRDAFQLASAKTTILQPVRGDSRRRASGRTRCASATASSRSRCRTSSRCAATRRTGSRARAASARRRAAELLAQYGSLDAMLEEGRFAAEADALRLYREHRHARRRGAAAAAARRRRRTGRPPPPTRASSGWTGSPDRLEEAASWS